ncbi:MAG: hypothetical protein K8T20_17925 [Planctomycetes bacterium]|nr:hypothetical protein [Planctomycetota bacterium]
MKRLIAMVVVAAVGCAGRAGAEESAAAVSGGTLRLEERGRAKVFVFAAKTTKKDGERLKIKLHYVRRYKIPPGLVAPGEPDFEEELIDIDKDDAVAKDGALASEMGASDLEPWPGRYRVVVSWPDAEAPSDDGMAKAEAEAEIGDAKDLGAMRARVDREVYEDMARIGRILDSIGDRWKHLGANPDATWADFRKTAARRIDAVKQRNGRRRTAEIYWMEARGKQRIDWTFQKLCPLLDAASQHLGKPAANRPDPKELDLALADTEEDYRHYLDYLGFGRIVDAESVDSALSAVGKIAGEVKEWRAKAAGDPAAWMEASADLGARLMESTLKLSGELPESYFARAEAVGKITLRMIDHVRELAAGKKPAVEWEELERKLEAAVKELQESVPRVSDE